MVKLYKAALLAFATLVSSVASAQAAVPQGKIAVLDLIQAVLRTDEAQKRLKALHAQPAYDANSKEREKLQGDIEKTEQKLANPNFVQKVPPQVLAEHQQRALDLKAKLEHVLEALKALEG